MIVHIITGLGLGGAEHALYRLLTVSAIRTEAHVICLTVGGPMKEKIEKIGVNVTCMNFGRGFPSPLKLLALVRLLRALRPRLVQTWMYHADLLGGIASKVVGVPVCWSIRNSDLSYSRNKLKTIIIARFCAWMSALIPNTIVSCSTKAAQIHRAFGYKAPMVVISNGIDESEWSGAAGERAAVRLELQIPEHTFVFAHAGRADIQKDHPTLARAFSTLCSRRSDAILLLCGFRLSSESEYFRSLPFSVDAIDQVRALGVRGDLPRLWGGADAFVMSSAGEAFPNVVLEAMAAGLPCVATDVGDSAKIVGSSGFIVEPGNPDALSDAMETLMDLPKARLRQLGRQAADRVTTGFSIGQMAAEFERHWESVIVNGANRCVD